MKNIIFTAIAFTALTMTSAHAAQSCYVMGDSIAFGTATQLPQCQSDAKVGLNTKDALNRFIDVPYTQATVISLGVNDRGTSLPTDTNLEIIRARVHSPTVVWILPTDAGKKAVIERVAHAHNDLTIDLNSPDIIKHVSTVDHIHPDMTGYHLVATKAKALAKL